MLKYVLIGVGIIAISGFIIWNLWKAVLLRRQFFRQGEELLQRVAGYADAAAKIEEARSEWKKTLRIGMVVTILSVLITILYFPITRVIFVKNHEHIYAESIIKDATCFKEGVLQYECRYCDEKYEESIPLIAHEYEETSHQDPTCMQEGVIIYACKMCGDSKDETIPVIEHNYVESARTDPTCGADGSIVYSCETCDKTYTETIQAEKVIEHTYAETEKMEPNCLNAGLIKYRCKVCGNEKTEEIPISEEHQYTIASFTKSSFWEMGYNNLVCELCDSHYYELSIGKFNWLWILLLIFILFLLVVIIGIYGEEGCWEDTLKTLSFWICAGFTILTSAIFIYQLKLAWVCLILFILLYWSFVLILSDERLWSWIPIIVLVIASVFIIPRLSKSIPIDCNLSETSRVESTSTVNGTVTYTCTDCQKEYTEYLPLKGSDPEQGEDDKQQEYVEIERTEEIPINEKHQYTIVSFTEPSFWKIGYNNCVCELCGSQYYSLRVNKFNWVSVLSVIIIAVFVITIVGTPAFETVWFWVSAVLYTLAVGALIYHVLFVYPYQVDGEHSYEQLAFDPTDDCRLTETGRTESTYEENGTVTYTCGDCGKEYVEYLPLGEFDRDQAAIYVESQITDVTETLNNGSIQGATDVPLFSKVTGRLKSEKDLADYYCFTLNTASNMKFKFSHDGDNFPYHWNATVYDTDGTTVLKEGYICTDEVEMPDLNAGTYYLKISEPTGSPMFSFSDANYYITFMPECIEHPSTTQYFYKIPTCKEVGEAVDVCDECRTVIPVDEIKPLEHKWGEWTITKEASITSAGEKSRNCLNCDEVQYGVVGTYIWVIPLAVIELILVLAGVIYFFSHITGTGKSKGGAVVMILLLIGVSAASSIGIINTPALVAEPVKKKALEIVLVLNITNIIGAIATMLKN